MNYIADPLLTVISFAPPSKGQAPAPPPPFPAFGIFFGNPLATLISFSAPAIGHAMPLHGAQYIVLQPHWINNIYYDVGQTIAETSNDGPGQVPVGWIPTLAVDPINSFAVTAFYNAGPRGISYEDLAQWANSQWANVSPSPVYTAKTFWVKHGNQYSLTGLGAGLPPITGSPFGG